MPGMPKPEDLWTPDGVERGDAKQREHVYIAGPQRRPPTDQNAELIQRAEKLKAQLEQKAKKVRRKRARLARQRTRQSQ
jgi:hypothetical protein